MSVTICEHGFGWDPSTFNREACPECFDIFYEALKKISETPERHETVSQALLASQENIQLAKKVINNFVKKGR